MGFFCICKRRRDSINGGSVSLRLRGARISRTNRGLDQAVIQTFPTFKYAVVKRLQFGKEALECAVCLNEFEDNDMIRLLPKCDHVFHPECIDAWLSKRTSCPVCRANLVPDSGETMAIMAAVQDLDSESEAEILGLETVDVENQQVTIHVSEEEASMTVGPEVINLAETEMQNRPSRFLRSHSTGHSLVQPGEDVERYTLRLPDELRKQIMNKRLNRINSMGVLTRMESPRQGYRMTGEGSSRGGRFKKPDGWVFSMMTPFFLRRSGSSASSPKMTPEGDATSATPPPRLSPAKPFWSPFGGEGARV
ncbi:hypothetical protein NE237_018354 [Protea cynaroides]|uniref:RING-type E3 ubiquitin transferase n=1 Tax=Protea cynaroides TaxID=273540 RepID=A0A9Q0QNV0_9MAGN|nr:hypothetical protein NE237_018354 [Protea cynaroides]